MATAKKNVTERSVGAARDCVLDRVFGTSYSSPAVAVLHEHVAKLARLVGKDNLGAMEDSVIAICKAIADDAL